MSTPQTPPNSHNGHSKGSDETPNRPEAKTFRLNPEIFPSTDITEFARSGEMWAAILCAGAAEGGLETGALPRLIQTMARGLARGHCRHLLVTGQRGIGKTTLVDELGRRAALAKIPSLRDVQFLSVNVTDAEPDESRARFLAMLACLTEQAFLPERLPGCRRGDESFNPLSAWLGNLVLVLDGLGALLRGEGGRTNTALFRTVLRRTSMRVIGILSQWEFDELLSGEPEILELCTRIEVPEPDEALAVAILRRRAPGLEEESGCRIAPEALEKLVTLSAKFIWNRYLPEKAIEILERMCDDARFAAESRSETSIGELARERRGGAPHPYPLPGEEGDHAQGEEGEEVPRGRGRSRTRENARRHVRQTTRSGDWGILRARLISRSEMATFEMATLAALASRTLSG